MRQIDVRNSGLRFVGGLISLTKSTMFLFSILLWGITIFGLYQVTLHEYIPNFWVFVLLIVSLFLALMVVQYKVLTPLELAFTARQSYIHDNPIADELRVIRREIEGLRKRD